MKKVPKAKKVGPKTKKTTTRVKKTTAAEKQSNLEKLNLADGKLEVEKVRQLEEILGVDQMNIFRTNDIEVFKENLAEMTTTDMQTLAGLSYQRA